MHKAQNCDVGEWVLHVESHLCLGLSNKSILVKVKERLDFQVTYEFLNIQPRSQSFPNLILCCEH